MKMLSPIVSILALQGFRRAVLIIPFLCLGYFHSICQTYTFSKATMCKDVQDNHPYSPINETTSFKVGDTPHAWIELTNVIGTTQIRFDWYRPNGSFYSRSTTPSFSGSGGFYRYSYSKNLPAVMGQWHVKFYAKKNGYFQLLATRYFNYEESCICTAIYDPVCGSDGVTYSNSCEAECAGVTWTAGECNSCICPTVYDPVCGSDGVTYSNSCRAECAGVTWTAGECGSSNNCINPNQINENINCTAQYDPVCGCDGKTYSNSCVAWYHNGVTSYTSGACPNSCTCPAVYDPVCGSDGITYSNSCEAECAGVTWTAGECNNCICPTVYDPVCGSDGVTYSNSCRAECAGVSWTAGACGSNNNCSCTNSYADYICDEFQSYSTNRRLGPQSSCWTTWSGNEGGAEDAIVQRNNTTANQFLRIEGTNSSGGPQDVVLKLGNRTSGRYKLKFSIWLNYGDKGYYNIQHRFREGGGNSNEWASNIYFDGTGSGRLIVRNSTYRFTYSTGKWIDVEQIIDLNNDDTYLYIDGRYVHRWRFSYQASNTRTGTKQLSAINFYPAASDHLFYIDNVELSKLSNLSEDSQSESRSKPEGSTVLNNTTSNEVIVSPNPFTNTINVRLPEVAITNLSIIDQLGRAVYTHPEQIDKATFDINLDLANLPKGVYYLRLLTPEQLITKKIVKSSQN